VKNGKGGDQGISKKLNGNPTAESSPLSDRALSVILHAKRS